MIQCITENSLKKVANLAMKMVRKEGRVSADRQDQTVPTPMHSSKHHISPDINTILPANLTFLRGMGWQEQREGGSDIIV